MGRDRRLRRSSSSSSPSRRRRRDARDGRRRRSRSGSPSRHRGSRHRRRYSRSESRSSSSESRSDYKSKYRSRDSRRKPGKSSRSKRRSSSSEGGSPPPAPAATKKREADDTEAKIKKAIEAAEAAGLTMCKLPVYEQREVQVKEHMPTMQDRNVLDELNADSFAPKAFSSSKSKKIPENIVIDLDAGTVKLPDVQLPKADSPLCPELFPDEKIKMDKWVRKMYQFRQKALRGEI